MGWLGERALTRRAWLPGVWAGGEFTPGASADTEITGTWRPMPEREVELLPEGDRVRDPRVLYIREQLTLAEQGTGQLSDHISPDGGTTWYELMGESDGSADFAFVSSINHYRYPALKVQEVG